MANDNPIPWRIAMLAALLANVAVLAVLLARVTGDGSVPSPPSPRTPSQPGRTVGTVPAKKDGPIHIGYVQSVPATGTPKGTVFLLPGFTLTATQFTDWFAPPLNAAGWTTVAMDYRSFGLSTGPWGGAVGPTDAVYTGMRTSAFASDAMAIMHKLKLTDVVILGHSYGVAVGTAWVDLYGATLTNAVKLRGFAAVDQSPMLSSPGWPAAVSTYPTGSTVFDFSSFTAGLVKAARYSEEPLTVHQDLYPAREFHYPNVAGWANGTFHSVEKLSRNFVDLDAAKGGCVCYSQDCLVTWAAGTDYWSAMNGRAIASISWSDIGLDYTDSWNTLRKADVPVFVYGGNWSLNPVENMFWIWDQVGANTGSKLLVFEDEFGVHTPWLNPGPSGGATGWFMVNLTEWVGARAKGSGVAW